MALFWEKSTDLPPLVFKKWRGSFHTVLLAKYDVDTEDIQNYIPRPGLG